MVENENSVNLLVTDDELEVVRRRLKELDSDWASLLADKVKKHSKDSKDKRFYKVDFRKVYNVMNIRVINPEWRLIVWKCGVELIRELETQILAIRQAVK